MFISSEAAHRPKHLLRFDNDVGSQVTHPEGVSPFWEEIAKIVEEVSSLLQKKEPWFESARESLKTPLPKNFISNKE